MKHEDLEKLVTNALKRYGRLPTGVDPEDARQEAWLAVLTWEPRFNAVAYSCNKSAFLCMKAWGHLKDKFAKAWKEEYAVKEYVESGRDSDNKVSDGPDEGPCHFINRRIFDRSAPEHAVPDEHDRLDVVSDVRSAIAMLPEREGQIVTLRLEGLTQAQIATALGISQGLVSRLSRRADQCLAIVLEDYK